MCGQKKHLIDCRSGLVRGNAVASAGYGDVFVVVSADFLLSLFPNRRRRVCEPRTDLDRGRQDKGTTATMARMLKRRLVFAVQQQMENALNGVALIWGL